jgi:3-oxoacyl-(acyl-carrier-protein) synthase
MDLVGQFATVAVGHALADAALADPADLARVGLVVGTTRGAVSSFDRYLDSVRGERWGAAKAIAFPKLVMSSIGGEVSTALGLKGIASTLVDGTGCGLQALAHAFEYVRQNDTVDAVVVVAADEVQELFFGLADRLGVLSGNGFGPYHPRGAGMVLGEGAVALVLERFSSADRRGAPVLAELGGYGLASDVPGAGSDACALERAARLALEEAGASPAEVDVVYGHGRGLPAHDGREVEAFGRLFGRHVPVGCVMGNTGVAEAASGLFSVAAALLGMQHGEAYPVLSEHPLGVELDYVRRAVRPGEYRRTLVAGSTEQGNNAAVVLTRRES